MERAIILAPNGYNGGTVECYSDPVGFEEVWVTRIGGGRYRTRYYVKVQAVAWPVERSLTFEQYREACADAGVECAL